MNENNEKSWWGTLPGIITATASLITAIGGLIVILNTIGYLSPKQKNISDYQKKESIFSSPKKEGENRSSNVKVESQAFDNIKTIYLKGTVGKLQAMFSLTFNFNTKKIQGSYYYPRRKNVTYRITGVILSNGIELTEFTSNVKTATCSLNIFNNCYNGKMYNTDGREFYMSICEIDN